MIRAALPLLTSGTAILLAAPLLTTAPAFADTPAETVLTGTLTHADLGSYRELPFDVPAGTSKITIDVTWLGREKGTTLVNGLYDPERLRGWGGGIKPHIVVADSYASSSYLPGPIHPGVWRLSLAVASIRAGETSPYKVTVHFDHGAAAQVITPSPIRDTPGWYRGDLHTHTGESDAACQSQSGKAVPCPVYFTLDAAAKRGLDFLVVTDHNATSQVGFLAELAPYFDRMLVIPGREMTTQYGHYNLLGITDFVDFRLGTPGQSDINAMFDASAFSGALISVNHPEIPTGEDCLGCGWSAPGTDYRRVSSIEVANGGLAADKGHFDDGKGSGTAYWEDLLNKGFHLTGVGGSDNHDPIDGRAAISPVGAQSPVGTPTTVVYAQALSQPAILAGIKAGRVFIDVDGSHRAALLDLTVRAGAKSAAMGGTLSRGKGQAMEATVSVRGMSGSMIDLIIDGDHNSVPGGGVLTGDNETLRIPLAPMQQARWLRVDVRDKDGKRLLIGNPVYIDRDRYR
ncbi:CehA/McbA family metallohydrolase [Novosphingobium sp.]|uniref:CehA/McbA family metallohydrolase n=1 Tax=Novosphingobium sp. TaxID=1874826 RepID=UPI0031D729BB